MRKGSDMPEPDVIAILREQVAGAWDRAAPDMQRISETLSEAYPDRDRELLVIVLAIAIRTVAATTGYSSAVPELLNTIWEEDPKFRWRLLDVQN